MRAATYCRFSSDKQRETSIADQLTECEQHAKRFGWEIVARYKDSAISGATDDRPGFQAMLKDAEAGKWDVLLCYDISRVARNLRLFLGVAEDFKAWGRRLVSVNDNQDSDSPTFKLMSGVLGSFAEHFRDALGARVRVSIRELAKKGLARGGRTYGYMTVTMPDGTKRWKPDPAEAKVVKQIFAWFAAGQTANWIAAELNRLKVPTPRRKVPGIHNGRSYGWTASTIQGCRMFGSGILNNLQYRGELRWNTMRWTKRRNGQTTGPKLKREPLSRPNWVVTKDPSLKIIDDDLWQAVKARQDRQWEASNKIRKAMGAAARTGRRPKFLLSGLLRCDCCNSTYSIRDGKRYACSGHFYHGKHVCKNDVTVPRTVIEQAVLGAVKGLWTAESFEIFKTETRKVLADHRKNGHADTKALQRQIHEIDNKVRRIETAIEDGAWSPTLKTRLEELGKHRTDIEAKLRHDPKAFENVADILPRAADRFHKVFNDAFTNATKTPSREMSQARRLLAALVGDEIRLIPTEGGGLSCRLQSSYAGMFQLLTADGWKVPNPEILTRPR